MDSLSIPSLDGTLVLTLSDLGVGDLSGDHHRGSNSSVGINDVGGDISAHGLFNRGSEDWLCADGLSRGHVDSLGDFVGSDNVGSGGLHNLFVGVLLHGSVFSGSHAGLISLFLVCHVLLVSLFVSFFGLLLLLFLLLSVGLDFLGSFSSLLIFLLLVLLGFLAGLLGLLLQLVLLLLLSFLFGFLVLLLEVEDALFFLLERFLGLLLLLLSVSGISLGLILGSLQVLESSLVDLCLLVGKLSDIFLLLIGFLDLNISLGSLGLRLRLVCLFVFFLGVVGLGFSLLSGILVDFSLCFVVILNTCGGFN